MNKIEIGAVAKPQGIKGELKLRLFADNFESVKNVKKVEIGGAEYTVSDFRYASGEEAIISLKEITDRNFAETLRKKEVYACRSEVVLPENRYFISDVIGCSLYLSSGKKMGEITDIVSGNVDYYYITTAEGNAVFPLIKDLLVSIDVENKKVVIDAHKFTEVVMYEN